MSAAGENQVRCDYGPCGKTQWRHRCCRVGAKRFCSADCRTAHLREQQREASEQLLFEINGWYGEGVMHALGAPCTQPINGFPGWVREQFLLGIRDGRAARGGVGT